MKVWTQALFSSVAIPCLLCFITCYCAVFFSFLDYKNLYLLSILHLYHHLFAELVHLSNLPLYLVCWGHKRFLVFDCKVVWDRLSSSYASHGLINLGSSTWGKVTIVLQNSAFLEAQHESTRINCVIDIKLFSGAFVGEVSAWRYIFRSCNWIF